MFRISLMVLFCLSVAGCNEEEAPIPNGTEPSNNSPETDSIASNDLLMKCSDCGKDVSKRAVSCPHCGAPLGTNSTNESPRTTPSPTTDLQPEPQLPRSGGLSSFEGLCNTLVSTIKSQDPEKLLAMSYFPSLRDWNDYVTKRTDELKNDPDTALIAKRTKLQNTLDVQSYKSLKIRHDDAMYQLLKGLPSLRHASYVAEFLTNGAAGPELLSVIDSMTFKIETGSGSFWGRDRHFGTLLVSVENVLVSIQFVACVDGNKKWWLCSDKLVVQFVNETFLESMIAANNYEIQQKVGVRDNVEDINKALAFLADHPTPPTQWDWFNNNPKSYKRLTEVSGVVTHDGNPLADATIVIYPSGGDGTAKPAVGKTDAEGNFSLVTTFPVGGAVVGAYEGTYTLFVVKYKEIEISSGEGEPPADDEGGIGEYMDAIGDDMDPTPKSLINEIFGLAYSTESGWNNRCIVGDFDAPTRFTITLNSDGTGNIVGVTK